MRSRPSAGLVLALTGVIVAGAIASVIVLRGAPRGPLPAGARPTIVQDDAVLLHGPESEVDRALARLRALGTDWIRVTAGWSAIAPAPASTRRPRFDAADPGAYPRGSWSAVDRVVRLARRHGMQAMIDVAFWAPRWATARASPPPAERYRWGVSAPELGRFAQAVALRYSGRYEGLPAARAFTIWNEPNSGAFLLPQWRAAPGGGWEGAAADSYRAMLYAAYPAIKRQAPASLVLVGATSQGPYDARPGSGATSTLRFLRQLACVSDDLRPLRTGACARFRPLPGDGWSHHPYSPRGAPARSDANPDNVPVADLGRLTSLLARLHAEGRTQRPLDVWVTEYGYETNPPDPNQPAGLADQARYLPQAEELALRNPHVRSFAQFLLRDLPGSTRARRWELFQSGLELPDGSRKPAMRSFAYGLTASRADGGRVRFWGHVRPGRGRRAVRVTASGRPVGDVQATDPHGYFTFSAPADPAATFRLELRSARGWRAVGVPVRGAGGR